MPTAQQVFQQLLRESVAPRLRALGLKGSGQQYAIPSETHWALLGFQKSAWSTRDRIIFTVNMTVVAREAWSKGRRAWPNLPERPGANWEVSPLMEDAFDSRYWHHRIGGLMPDQRDEWWEVEATGAQPGIATEVVAAVRDYALPAMRERLSRP